MTGSNDTIESRELLAHLRRGVRKSRQLAEELIKSEQVGDEARVLLVRLQDIGAELETMKALEATLRQIENDPIWSKSRWHAN